MKLSRSCVHAQPSTLVLWAGPRDLALLLSTPCCGCSSIPGSRRQLHGEDHLSAEDIHHLLAVGSRRAAGIREHVASGVQRCGGDPLHV